MSEEKRIITENNLFEYLDSRIGEVGAFDIGIKKEDCEVYYKIGQDVRNAVSLLKDAKATLDEQIRKEW